LQDQSGRGRQSIDGAGGGSFSEPRCDIFDLANESGQNATPAAAAARRGGDAILTRRNAAAGALVS
jgi:hypothetical protein